MQTDVEWKPAYRHRIHTILRHPAYKGDLVYGRRVTVRGRSRRQLDPDQIIVVPGHHEAYVTPERWERIQAQLRRNQLNVRQPAGPGPALCQGIIRCGKCNRPMVVHYHQLKNGRGYTYACANGNMQFGEPVCWCVSGPRFDEVVVAELLQSLRPPDLEAVLAAAADANAGYQAVLRQREAELLTAKAEAEFRRR